ncbi:DUF3450 domain-containing protein [Desulfogranum japonicum]|uniref:DUF3450 domain-containing protein n=1 Tax=Desulfogranum japonicum TaxID=231447 RepID=UPI0003F61F61|nr:DUF3450 domain-containing protein [Desulfogranum japonicum]
MVQQLSVLGILLVFLFTSAPVHSAEVDDQVQKTVQSALSTRKKNQQEEEQWRQEQARLQATFETLEAEVQELRLQQNQLETSIQDTQQRIVGKTSQIADIDEITAQIEPFLDELFISLKKAIDQGLPFLQEEREQRLYRITSLGSDPSVSISERYRRLAEALLVEAEYGFTTEVYQQKILLEGSETLVDIFRLGRLNLFYLTLDGTQCGSFNPAEKQWHPLSVTNLPAIQSVIAMGRKQHPIELVNLPIGQIQPMNQEVQQ